MLMTSWLIFDESGELGEKEILNEAEVEDNLDGVEGSDY